MNKQTLYDDLGHHLHCTMSQCWDDAIGYCERCGERSCLRHMPDGRVCWGCKKDEFAALQQKAKTVRLYMYEGRIVAADAGKLYSFATESIWSAYHRMRNSAMPFSPEFAISRFDVGLIVEYNGEPAS